jgi:hypothetical protein
MEERVAGWEGMKGEVWKGKFRVARGRWLRCARLVGTNGARRRSDLRGSRRSERLGLPRGGARLTRGERNRETGPRWEEAI